MTSIKLLTQNLADLNVLSVKLQNMHWNVEGSKFLQLHTFFEEQYNFISSQIDPVAERIRSLGEKVNGSLSTYLKTTSIKELDTASPDLEYLQNLKSDYGQQISFLKEAITSVDEQKDITTSALLQEQLFHYEKASWFINTLLK